jgi:hypothetical protein
VIVLVIADPVEFVAVNPGILVRPLPARPMAVLEFVQVKLAPAGLLTKVFAGIATPAQAVMLDSATTEGVGLTVIV